MVLACFPSRPEDVLGRSEDVPSRSEDVPSRPGDVLQWVWDRFCLG